MIQDIDRIKSQLELFAFRNPEALHQVHIQIEPAGATQRVRPKRSHLSRLRIHQNDLSARILDRLEVVADIQTIAGTGRCGAARRWRRALREQLCKARIDVLREAGVKGNLSAFMETLKK